MIAIDAHVHFYPMFDIDRFLDTAATNLAAASMAANHAVQPPRLAGVLCMAETADCRWFETLTDGLRLGSGWTVEATPEVCSRYLIAPHGQRLIVIAGHQVVTQENVELLVVGQTEKPKDGQPAEHLVFGLKRAGEALMILPWGFGKWWGRRGALIKSLIEAHRDNLYVGDNSGRTSFLRRPRILEYAESLGIADLAGSDPLPLAGEEATVGRLAVCVDDLIDLDHPFDSLKRSLAQTDKIRRYGRNERPLKFAKHQLLMQARKRA